MATVRICFGVKEDEVVRCDGHSLHDVTSCAEERIVVAVVVMIAILMILVVVEALVVRCSILLRDVIV